METLAIGSELLFRRQFILGGEPADGIGGWRRERVGGRIPLAAHPDLPVEQLREGELELTLLGFMIDPDAPERDNAGVLRSLAGQGSSQLAVAQATMRIGGRWILIGDNGRETFLFTDPCGLRQVCYHSAENGDVWCASQPGLLSESLGLPGSEEAHGFMESIYFRTYREYWWPGSGTSVAGVRHLLPNHYLDLRSGRALRFWPWEPCQPRELAEACGRGAEVLRGMIAGAANRSPVALPLTAGVDSRLLLAASRDLRDRILYFTMLREHTRPEDIEVPRKLAARLGLHHVVIDCREEADGQFGDLYARNVTTSHEAWRDMTAVLLREFPEDHVVLTGNCAEIMRRYYHQSPVVVDAKDREVTPELLAALENAEENEYALAQHRAWLAGAETSVVGAGYDLLDIYYWEQRMGRWQAMHQLERDLAHETLSPYNSRELFTTFLGVDVALRSEPVPESFTTLTRILWPDVLIEPFNPIPWHIRMGRAMREETIARLGDTRVFGHLKNIYRKARARLR